MYRHLKRPHNVELTFFFWLAVVWTSKGTLHGDIKVSDSWSGTHYCSETGKWIAVIITLIIRGQSFCVWKSLLKRNVNRATTCIKWPFVPSLNQLNLIKTHVVDINVKCTWSTCITRPNKKWKENKKPNKKLSSADVARVRAKYWPSWIFCILWNLLNLFFCVYLFFHVSVLRDNFITEQCTRASCWFHHRSEGRVSFSWVY